MTKRANRQSILESLESRTFLSAVPAAAPSAAHEGAAIVVKAAAKATVGTVTTVTAQAGLLGQAISFTATVRAAAATGSPTGQVEFAYQGHVFAESDLTAGTSTSAQYAISMATYTIATGGGNWTFGTGPHAVSARYVPDVTFQASRGATTFFVKTPKYTHEGRLKLATVDGGGGTGITTGQTANVYYTGMLLSDGTVFDFSDKDGGTPLSYTVGNGQVVTGFDNGTVGMSVGETRVLVIPPGLAYGQTAQGLIPAGGTLVFIITLSSIS